LELLFLKATLALPISCLLSTPPTPPVGLSGIFVALMYRFDVAQAAKHAGAALRTPYFTASFGAYIAGLGLCIVIMQVFQAAQVCHFTQTFVFQML
jgi:hypothetical protein